ncbi:Fic family protein [Cupriavidus pauculus]|uniref:Fic family protein n=1 Tax=Cupriavidus pauculus TaxID=82633 RepID=UPI001248BB73|nr:Fic family protein [Cupriavidus pauculus]KAB0596023.1 hypothetical protein F7R19_27920 [Cupriavidus pauculus]MCM3608224.1 Fic family protein [Cupriavidus pauculus]UAL00376.1 Fic family protein [Cupriavidus pauculus]
MHASHIGASASCACYGWDYEKYEKGNTVERRCFDLLISLRKGEVKPTAAIDTRPTHQKMFNGLTHADCPYFAGAYRGSRDCLVGYEVKVGSATTEQSANVAAAMDALSSRIKADLDLVVQAGKSLSPADALVARLDVVLDRMVEFLTIHPYANGNGHMQRFIVWCFFAAMNFWPKHWPMDTRPPSPYDQYISAYRQGVKDPLRHYMLSLLARKPK